MSKPNILSVIINKLVEKIEQHTFNITLFDAKNLLNEIIIELKNVINYINHSELEITRLNKEVTRLNADLIKTQLNLLEYKKKESDSKKN